MLSARRAQLDCAFSEIDSLFADCLSKAERRLSPEGIDAWLESARLLGKLGRGVEPVKALLQSWPETASCVGEDALPAVMQAVQRINKSPNGRALAPLLQSLPAVAHRLQSVALLQQYLELGLELQERTSGSIHGIHKTYASPCLIAFYEQAPQVLQNVSMEGMRAWAQYGMRHYSQQPEQQQQYFALQLADSRAVLQRERHGTLLVDQLRPLDLTLRALWQDPAQLVPYATAPGSAARSDPHGTPGAPGLPGTMAEPGTHQTLALQPYYDAMGLRLPDVYDDAAGVSGLDRYRAALAHMAAHRRWSTPLFADNYSPAQRLAIECLEDARVDLLAMRTWPGLRATLLALLPAPAADACDPATQSCLRHRLARFARSLLCKAAGPWSSGEASGASSIQAMEGADAVDDLDASDPVTQEHAARWQAAMTAGDSSSAEMATLAIGYLAKTRRQSDQLGATWFDSSATDYRDDNRHLWKFHELSDDEESFDTARQAVDTQQLQSLPPRHYAEWDYSSQSYRPDWVSLYEGLHPSGDARAIDQLLERHHALARRLKKMLDLLKPHARERLRHQEDGSELDLDVALRAWTDLQAGSQPDARITQSQQSNSRSIAVTLLLDLSESLNDPVPGSTQSVLQLSQEAVALLAWTVEQLGDPLAIAGFHSNTRHDVRYLHLKGFGEHWGEAVKSRLAAMQAGYSTRMGAALRHAAHTLAAQKADTRLLLVLTDGRPSDVDVADEQLLVQDARQAVKELAATGITSYCINLDAAADSYVRDVFGKQYTVVDQIASLPEKLPRLFMRLTR